MDLALAYLVRAALAAAGTHARRVAARARSSTRAAAPRRRCSPPTRPTRAPVAILGRSRKRDRRHAQGRARARRRRAHPGRRLLPARSRADARAAARSPRRVSREIGLPYARDPRVTRHLAEFLARHARRGDADRGALQRRRVEGRRAARARRSSVLRDWCRTATSARARAASDLDLAVARGAAYYGLARRGRGIRIRGGTARAYYVGVETRDARGARACRRR